MGAQTGPARGCRGPSTRPPLLLSPATPAAATRTLRAHSGPSPPRPRPSPPSGAKPVPPGAQGPPSEPPGALSLLRPRLHPAPGPSPCSGLRPPPARGPRRPLPQDLGRPGSSPRPPQGSASGPQPIPRKAAQTSPSLRPAGGPVRPPRQRLVQYGFIFSAAAAPHKASAPPAVRPGAARGEGEEAGPGEGPPRGPGAQPGSPAPPPHGLYCYGIHTWGLPEVCAPPPPPTGAWGAGLRSGLPRAQTSLLLLLPRGRGRLFSSGAPRAPPSQRLWAREHAQGGQVGAGRAGPGSRGQGLVRGPMQPAAWPRARRCEVRAGSGHCALALTSSRCTHLYRRSKCCTAA